MVQIYSRSSRLVQLQYVAVIVFFSFFACKSGFIDNRNLPLWSYPFHITCEKPSGIQIRAFALTARNAYDSTGNDKNSYNKGASIPDLWGCYNLARVAKQLELAGYPNPLQEEFRHLANIPFDSKGRIQGQGVWFAWYQSITPCTFLGIDFSVLNASADARYCLKRSLKLALANNTTDSIIWQLYRDRQEVNQELGLNGEQYSVSGFSDIDAFIGINKRIEYCLKLRSLTMSARIGTLLPIGERDNVFDPVSLSLSGVGKYGIYGRVDANAELCEDWNISFWAELLGRTPRTQKMRLLVNRIDNKQNSNIGVPQAYAPLIANVKVEPGITFGLGIWGDFAYLKDGWGLNGGYTMIHHADDDWTILGDTCPNRPPSFGPYNRLTGWDAEWITVGVFHNPMLTEEGWCRYLPVFYFDWSIPVHLLIAKNVPKTNKISLGFEFDF